MICASPPGAVADHGLAVEKAELARGTRRSRVQAREHAGQLVESLGGNRDTLNQPAIPPPDPARKAQLEFVASQSQMISRIWGEIKETIGNISFDVLAVGLPVVNAALMGIWGVVKLIEGAFTGVKIAIEAISIPLNVMTGSLNKAVENIKQIGRLVGINVGGEEKKQPGDPKESNFWEGGGPVLT